MESAHCGPALYTHARDTRSWFWKIVTWTEKKRKKEYRSVAVNGKDDSGESVFSSSSSERQILKLPGPWSLWLCVSAVSLVGTCMRWHNNTVAFCSVCGTFGDGIVSPWLSHYWNMELNRSGILTRPHRHTLRRRRRRLWFALEGQSKQSKQSLVAVWAVWGRAVCIQGRLDWRQAVHLAGI